MRYQAGPERGEGSAKPALQGIMRVGRPGVMILVVDDDAAVRSSLQFSLEVEGFRVRTYRDACELLGESMLPEKGCLVIDYQLPGLNGLDLLAELRARRVALPAVLVTTRPNRWVRQRATKEGVPIIEKPLLTEELFRCIESLLSGYEN
jgi:FixJ family two-component response regulator